MESRLVRLNNPPYSIYQQLDGNTTPPTSVTAQRIHVTVYADVRYQTNTQSIQIRHPIPQ